MNTVYVAMLRGINVGGKNKISMTELRLCFEELGYDNVSTYINSGNVLFSSTTSQVSLAKSIEETLTQSFKLDTGVIKTLVISQTQLKKVLENAPKGFGRHPEMFHSDVAFLIDVSSRAAFTEFEPHPEVDKVWEGDGVIYYQRLSAKLTKSRLSRIVAKPVYKSMTIRTWNTVKKLYQRMDTDT